MAVQLIPYLTFDGNAREAMTFYASVLGGTPTFSTFGENFPEGGDGIMHAYLRTDAGLELMASDTFGDMPAPSGSAVTLSLIGDDAEAQRRWFAGLSEGGEVTMPLEQQMWGDEYGEFTDKFGNHWSVNVGTAPQDA